MDNKTNEFHKKETNYFIIGDIHGCFYTLIEILEYWDKETEHLILVGDLIDRGNFNSKVVNLCIELSGFDNCTVLKGNHEFEFIEYFEKGSNDNWMIQCGEKTIQDFVKNSIDQSKVYNWFKKMPLKLETDYFLVTHAGVSETSNPFDENNEDGVLWTRKPIKNIGKVQFHGHTPLLQNESIFNKISNSWNLDTGSYYGFGLSGLKINHKGQVTQNININTHFIDIQ